MPSALLSRRQGAQAFAFRAWDYEQVRDGAFVEARPLPDHCPLVSVITRTYRGRDRFLRQAILSVAHQTYPNIEHVIVEDGRETLRGVVDEAADLTGLRVRYLAIEKAGRSAAGNAGLAAAQGRWCVFLDDDDLLFADHVEALVQGLLDARGAVASYSPAFEVLTEYPADPEAAYSEIGHDTPPSLRQTFDIGVLRHHNFMAIQSVLFERRLFEERGGFELDMHALEDWVLWNLYACRNTFVFVPKTTSLFRTPASDEARLRRNATFSAAYELARERIGMRLLAVNGRAMEEVSRAGDVPMLAAQP
jgi:glycosyltransferase involved in cell wall biosynthesis